MSNKIFISHAAADKQLVKAFVELLQGGMYVNRDEIFCTSISGSLGIGDEFISRIREEITGCENVIFLITPEYKKSFMCQIEMGAAWALGKNIKPIIVPPLTFEDLEKPMDNRQAIMITDKDGLDQLFDELKVQKIASAGNRHFVEKLDEFILKCGILTADENGHYQTVVTEIYEVPGSKLCFYKLNGRVNKTDLEKLSPSENFENWSEEEHWIDARFVKVNGLREGDVISFELTGSSYMDKVNHGTKVLRKVRNLYYRNPSIVK